MTVVRLLLMLLLIPVLCSGCAAYRDMNRREACDNSIKDYNKLVRWQEAEKAAIAFVDPVQRAAYDKAAETLRRRNVSIADVRIRAQQCLIEQRTAESTVEFDYFILPDNRVKTVTDYQRWIYREADERNPALTGGWKLITPLPEFK